MLPPLSYLCEEQGLSRRGGWGEWGGWDKNQEGGHFLGKLVKSEMSQKKLDFGGKSSAGGRNLFQRADVYNKIIL